MCARTHKLTLSLQTVKSLHHQEKEEGPTTPPIPHFSLSAVEVLSGNYLELSGASLQAPLEESACPF